MKKIALLALFLICNVLILHAQDLIVKKDAEEIQAKVLEITSTEVKYKKFDNIEGPVYTLLKTDIFMIKYQNGTKDVFNEEPTEKTVEVKATEDSNNVNAAGASDMFLKGRMDAKRYYNDSGPLVGNFVCGVLFPLGIIPSAIIMATPPKDHNLGIANTALLEDKNYKAGYKKQAHNRKLTNSLIGGVAGVAVSIILGTLISNG